mgnify:FL=1
MFVYRLRIHRGLEYPSKSGAAAGTEGSRAMTQMLYLLKVVDNTLEMRNTIEKMQKYLREEVDEPSD